MDKKIYIGLIVVVIAIIAIVAFNFNDNSNESSRRQIGRASCRERV